MVLIVAGDLEKLQGAWHLTSLETDGEKIAPADFAAMAIVVDGNRFRSLGMATTYRGTLALGRSKALKTLDLSFTAGPQRGTTNRGIYKLDGGRWTICLSTTGTARPRTFSTKKATGLALETFERRAPRDSTRTERTTRSRGKQPRPTIDSHAELGAPCGPASVIEGEWAMRAAVFNGAPLDAASVKWCRRVTRGNVTAVFAGPRLMLEARFTLGASGRTGEIDYLNLAGTAKGKTQKGIYRLDDEGTLVLCMAAPGKPRPADFRSVPGDGRSYTAWRLTKR